MDKINTITHNKFSDLDYNLILEFKNANNIMLKSLIEQLVINKTSLKSKFFEFISEKVQKYINIEQFIAEDVLYVSIWMKRSKSEVIMGYL